MSIGRRVALLLVLGGLACACGSDPGGRNDGSAGSHAGGASGNDGGTPGSAGASGAGGVAGTGGGTGAAGVGGAGGRGGAAGGAAGRVGAGGSGAGGSAAGGGGRGGSGGRPACVPLDTSAAPINSLQHTDDPAPLPAGGSITSGTYYLSQMMYYGGTPTGIACNSMYREVLEIAATSDMQGTINDALNAGFGQPFNTYPVTANYQANGTMLTGTPTCGVTTAYGDTYSAMPGKLLFHRGTFDSDCYQGITLVLTFTKQ